MASARSYTISEAAGLTGLHGNTIRKRIKQGALEATVRQGKFGEEYRITYEALVAAGLIADAGPRRSGGADLVLEPEWVRDAPPPEAGSGADPGSTALQRAAEGLEGSALTPAGAAALNDLFQRHEQAIYRLGYLQAEVDRLKEIEEQARALEVVSRDQEKEVQELRHSLALRESEAAEAERLRAQLAAKAAEAAEAERLRA
ncbi:MAG: helix-turn-helix domain-containing protein, partial [Armatimonadetes bacterium]|nr:helix-turn-helix domain-containing protein [Armatimonadota bacterium]